MIIAFMGIDGTGKSTYAKALCHLLNSDCIYLHIDSIFANKLIFLYQNCRKNKNIQRDNINKQESKESYILLLIIHAIWMITLMLDNILWYLIRLRREIYSNKGTQIIICDRYFYDSLISAVYFLPISIRKIMYRLYVYIFPIPDKIFFLDADPLVAYLRKKEDNLTFLREKYRLYLEFLQEYKKLKREECKRMYIIKTDKTSIHTNIRRILKVVIK